MSSVKVPRTGLVALALGIVYVVWGSTYLAIKVVVEDAPPMSTMGLRFVAAGVVLGVVLAARNGLSSLGITGREALGAAALGLMLPMLGNGMVALAEGSGAESGFTALLIAMVPVFIVVFRLAEGDRPRTWTLLGVLLGFVGLTLLILGGRDSGHSPIGPSLVILLASLSWALGSYLQPRLSLPRDPFVTAVYEMFIGGMMMVATGQLFGERLSLDYSAEAWLAWGYLVVFGSVIAFSAYVWVVANAPISLVATYAYVNPVIAVFLGWLILDEHVTAAIVFGGAVVVGAVALVITSERRPRPQLPTDAVPDGEPANAL